MDAQSIMSTHVALCKRVDQQYQRYRENPGTFYMNSQIKLLYTMELQKQFEDLKAKYSIQGISDEDKRSLVVEMQNNLKERLGRENTSCFGLDRKEHHLDSENVEELYAIDGALRAQKKEIENLHKSAIFHESAIKQNKYSPSNPYITK